MIPTPAAPLSQNNPGKNTIKRLITRYPNTTVHCYVWVTRTKDAKDEVMSPEVQLKVRAQRAPRLLVICYLFTCIKYLLWTGMLL